MYGKKLVSVLILLICFAAGYAAWAAESPGNNESSEKKYVSIDFEGVDILVFIKYISELTGKNFVVDKGVKGTVTILSPSKISEVEAYKVFESVLEVHGYTTVPSGSVIKIIPAVMARSKSVDTMLKEDLSDDPDDRVVTQLISLNFARPSELKKLLAPMVSKNSVVIAYEPSRMFIITDVLSNINRLMRIIKEIDVSSGDEKIEMIPLKNSSAIKVAKSLNGIFQRMRATAKGARNDSVVRIVPDERSNMLIVLASKLNIMKVKDIVASLDAELPRGKGNVQVYYLQHANAEDLAKVLTALPGKQTQGAERGKQPTLSKEILIVADKSTNSLVITAQKEDYLTLEDVIKQLDIPRRMVYLEALIMEVNVEKDFRLGVEWLGLKDVGMGSKDAGIVGGFSGSELGSDPTYPGITGLTNNILPTGLSMGFFAESITIGDGDLKITFPTLGAVVQAYKSDSDVQIISNPQVLTTDNEEAIIQVGQNVPYLTKEASGDQTYQTYEYRDVGTTLKITPQINQKGVVRLKIFQEIIRVKGSNTDFRPTTLKRTAETTVIVQDKSTIVIGGIIGDDINQTIRKVPFLGDIPVLGRLFKSEANDRQKTNLFIFITPRIVVNPNDSIEIYQEKRDKVDKLREEMLEKLGIDKEVHSIEVTDNEENLTPGVVQIEPPVELAPMAAKEGPEAESFVEGK